MPKDLLIHIHSAPGSPCVACGDSDTEDTDFILGDYGYWNSLNRRCEPATIVGLVDGALAVIPRDDIRTCALLGERTPPRKKVPDPR